MGSYFSKVGSDPYYAGYERSLEALKATIETFQDKLALRHKRLAAVDGTLFMYGLAGFAIVAGLAAWALQQPPGVLSQRQHFLSVLPLFVEPVAVYTLYVVWNTSQSLLERRDKAKLAAAEAKLRKMITELKDTSHYQKTLTILSKYDPDFVAPTPPPAARQEPRTPGGPLPFRSLRSADSACKDTPWRQSMVGRMTGAGMNIMPTLDKLASSLIGDNPALTQMLREAKAEAEALRERLALAEAKTAQLSHQNAILRERLGEAAEPSQPDATSEDGQRAVLSRLSTATAPSFETEAQDNDVMPGADPNDRRQSASAPVTPMSRTPHPGVTDAAGSLAAQLEAAGEEEPAVEAADSDFTFVSNDTPAVQQGAGSS